MFLAQPSKVLREILAYPFQEKKATYFLPSHKEPERFLRVHLRRKRPRFPFSCPDPRRFLGESLRILFNIERPRLVVCLTQGESYFILAQLRKAVREISIFGYTRALCGKIVEFLSEVARQGTARV